MEYKIAIAQQLLLLLKSLRKQSGLTQQGLGEKLGISQRMVAKIEANPEKVRFERILQILSELDADLLIRERNSKVTKNNSDDVEPCASEMEMMNKCQSDTVADELAQLKSSAYRTAIASVCMRYHVKRLMLFGSAARGELAPGSDIDLLAEFIPGDGPSLSGLVKMRQELADLLERDVDLVTPSILKNPFRRKAIMHDLEELYAA